MCLRNLGYTGIVYKTLTYIVETSGYVNHILLFSIVKRFGKDTRVVIRFTKSDKIYIREKWK